MQAILHSFVLCYNYERQRFRIAINTMKNSILHNPRAMLSLFIYISYNPSFLSLALYSARRLHSLSCPVPPKTSTSLPPTYPPSSQVQAAHHSEREVLPSTYTYLNHREADPDLKNIHSGFKQGSEGVIQVAGRGTVIAGSLALFDVRRDGETEAEAYVYDAGWEAWFGVREV